MNLTPRDDARKPVRLPSFEEMTAMSSEDVWAILNGLTMFTAAVFVTMAAALRVLRERDVDLSEWKNCWRDDLERVASGQLDPEALATFAKSPKLLRHVRALPLPQQKKLADGEPIKVLTPGSKEMDHRLVYPLEMGKEDMKQVFDGEGHIRTLPEQRAWLADEEAKARRKNNRPERIGKFRIDKEKGGAWIGHQFFPKRELQEVVSAIP